MVKIHSALVRKPFCILTVFLFLVCLCFVVQLWYYLLSEFVFCTHRDGQCPTCIGRKDPNATIPLFIHQIFFFITDTELPIKYRENQKTWINQNPGFQYKLWDAAMIDQLIKDKYSYIEDLYRSYGHWIRRSDVARYLVLHQYGGIYVDIDLRCSGPVTKLLDKIEHKGIVMYGTGPFGVTNDFLVAEARHPFFAYVIRGLSYANRWYVFPHAQTMLSTGPTYLTGRYYNFDQKDDIHILPRKSMSEYFERTPGYNWHTWDSATIKWFEVNSSFTMLFSKVLLTFTAVLVGILFLRALIKYTVRLQCSSWLKT